MIASGGMIFALATARRTAVHKDLAAISVSVGVRLSRIERCAR